ncbi:hypothetical protein RCH09_000247 [Actimicrobium sp. GrIS 1.19]|uniref:DUF2917 domain-containing protein n=1 Tax=Actimicrobium sp. GrIS 1.19 TaxID=3071708 RepID=UPI002DFCD59A|nr:hypothetical protein [Actimicrobium sp. GrIS 1.19]
MSNLFATQSSSIRADQVMSGVAERPQTLRVARGNVWVTIEGLRADFWLSCGDTLALPAHRLVVVEAHGQNAEVAVSAAPSAGGTARLGTLFGTLGRYVSDRTKPSTSPADCPARS